MAEPDTSTLHASVLGQLLLMQNVLCNLPDEQAIFGFICRGLTDLPGVSEVRHVATAKVGEAGGAYLRLSIQAGGSHWGDLMVNVSDRAAFAPYEPYLRNFVFMVAVILEERRHRQLNEAHNAQLEQRVQERTLQLTSEIVERRDIEEQLRRSRNMLAHTLDSVPQAVFWKNRQGVYLGCNQVFARAAGLDRPEQIVGKTDYELPWRDEAEAYLADDRRVIDQCLPKRHIIEPLLQSDGSRLWIDTTKVPLTDEAGAVYGVLGVYEDITERKLAEAEHERLQAQLTQAQKMESVGRLAGGVAHDFNNMLQAIIGYAGLALSDEPGSGAYKENIEEIQKAAMRSAELTHQLLAFARKQTVSPKVLDLNDTVASMLKMLQRLIGENIQLAWVPGPSLWPVWVDPVQIDQLLANLTVNARDAITGSGLITIETKNYTLEVKSAALPPDVDRGDYVVLTVRDTGCGMDQDTQQHLFEPFFTTKPVGQGTGLGLATVYGIVKQNHGYVTVQSEPGHGSLFTIHLPRCSLPTETVASAAEGRANYGTETVLLVEDEDVILRLACRILEQHGYKVLAARSPEEALGIVAQFPDPVHLIITDVIMPGMNGRELQERVAVLKPRLRCLYISGYTADVIAPQGVLEDGVQFLSKPFSVADFTLKVRQVLDGFERAQAPGLIN